MGKSTVDAVGAVIIDESGRLLLVRRAHEPSRGRWSLPGGHVEPGEGNESAVVREVREETGLDVVATGEVGSAVIEGPEVRFVVRNFRCSVLGGDMHSADDADDARWFTFDEVRQLPTSPRLVEHLTDWGVLPETR